MSICPPKPYLEGWLLRQNEFLCSSDSSLSGSRREMALHKSDLSLWIIYCLVTDHNKLGALKQCPLIIPYLLWIRVWAWLTRVLHFRVSWRLQLKYWSDLGSHLNAQRGKNSFPGWYRCCQNSVLQGLLDWWPQFLHGCLAKVVLNSLQFALLKVVWEAVSQENLLGIWNLRSLVSSH